MTFILAERYIVLVEVLKDINSEHTKIQTLKKYNEHKWTTIHLCSFSGHV